MLALSLSDPMTSSFALPMLLIVSVSAGCAAMGGQSGLAEAERRASVDAARQVSPALPFDESEARAAFGSGRGRIEGVLYTSRGRFTWVKKLQNDHTFHAATEIHLMPATAYTQSYLDLRRRNDQSDVTVELDPRAKSFMRSTKTDAYGRFVFEGLMPGRYLLLSDVFMRNGYTTSDVVGQGQNQFGTTTYTQQRRVDTSYYKLLSASVAVDGDGSTARIELNDQ